MDRYSTNLTIYEKSVDGMLGSQTQGGRVEGADVSIKLWQHIRPIKDFCMLKRLAVAEITKA